MSYIGHGLSHAIFGGFAASALLGVNFVLGAGAWGVASALLINGVTRRRVIGADAAIGVITTASFALGLALFALFGGVGRELRRGAVRQHPRRRRAGRAGRRRLVSARRRRRSSSFATARCCSRPSTPRSPTCRACSTARIDALLMVVLAAVDPRDDAGARRDADRRDARDPGDRRAHAHRLVQPDAVAGDRDRRGVRVRRA